MRNPAHRPAAVTALVVWSLIGLSAASTFFTRSPRATRWPSESPLARTPGRAQWVLFVHPRADDAVALLQAFEARCAGPSALTVVFLRGREGVDPAVERAARRVPGVTLAFDGDRGARAAFQVRRSGQLLQFDAEGELRFFGALETPTSLRGQWVAHRGDEP